MLIYCLNFLYAIALIYLTSQLFDNITPAFKIFIFTLIFTFIAQRTDLNAAIQIAIGVIMPRSISWMRNCHENLDSVSTVRFRSLLNPLQVCEQPRYQFALVSGFDSFAMHMHAGVALIAKEGSPRDNCFQLSLEIYLITRASRLWNCTSAK